MMASKRGRDFMLRRHQHSPSRLRGWPLVAVVVGAAGIAAYLVLGPRSIPFRATGEAEVAKEST
jgi:hypothetical protein